MLLPRPPLDGATLEELGAQLADLTVVCSDGPVLWHRALLAAWSPFLRKLLVEPDSVLLLRDFPSNLVARCFSLLCHLDSPGEMLAAGGDVRELCRVLHLSAGHGQGDHRLLPVKTEIEDAPGFAEPKVDIEDLKLAYKCETESVELPEEEVYSDVPDESPDLESDAEFVPWGRNKRRREIAESKFYLSSEEDLDGVGVKRGRNRKLDAKQNGVRKESILMGFKDKEIKKLNKNTKVLDPKPKRAASKSCPDVWLKDPSPDRFRDGVKTEEFYMSEETAGGGAPFKCLMCDHQTQKKRTLKIHFQSRHSKEKLYRCKVCGVAKVAKQKVVEHWQNIHNPNKQDDLKHVCDICGKMYATEHELRNHKVLHQGLQLPCRYCGNNFKTPVVLKAHEKRHETDRAPCNICGKLLNSLKEAKYHEFLVHLDTSTKDCKLCGKTLKPSSINSHMRRIHSKNKKNHNCHICGNRFFHDYNLQRHIEVVHEKSKQFQCPYCEAVLSDRSKFGRHSKGRHGGRDLPQTLKDLSRPKSYIIKINEPELD